MLKKSNIFLKNDMINRNHFKNPRLILVVSICIFFIFIIRSFSFPDLFALFYVPHWIGQGNVYSMVAENKPNCAWLDATYPPLYYLSTGVYINTLLALGFLPANTFTQAICPFAELVYNSGFLFWIKLPFLVFHLISGFVLYRQVDRNKFKWFLLWLTSPLIIFTSYIQGQFEIIPVTFILLSLYFAKNDRPLLSALFLGFGGAYKHFPFLLLPVLVISLAKSWRQAAGMALVSPVPYLLSIPPLLNTEFINRMLNFNENQKMLSLSIKLGDYNVSIYIILYLLILFKALFFAERGYQSVIKNFFLITLIYFITTPAWFLQRLLYLTPSLFLLAGYSSGVKKYMPIISFTFFFYALIFFSGLFDHTLLRPLFKFMTPIHLDQLLLNIKMNDLQAIISLIFTLVFLCIGFIVVRSKSLIETSITGRDILLHLSPLLFYFMILGYFIIYSGSHL